MMKSIPTVSSDLKSVRLFEGTFYASGWRELFTPLNTQEVERFMLLVNRAESARGRSLLFDELLKVVKEL